MAPQTTPKQTKRQFPDTFTYVCGHTYVGNHDSLQGIYKALLDNGLVAFPEAEFSLTHHCAECLVPVFMEAFSKDGSESQRRKWGDMALHPLNTGTTDISTNLFSSLVMFRDLVGTMNVQDMHKVYFERDDPVVHDLFFTFRHWCRTMALHIQRQEPEHEALERLMAVMKRVFGPLMASDVQDLVDLYRLQPRDVTSMMPGDPGERDRTYRRRLARFHEAVKGPFSDMSKEYHGILRAASQWSAELLGPPQPQDLHREAFADLIAKDKSDKHGRRQNNTFDAGKLARLETVILDLNDEAMRFKIQLYVLFKSIKQAGQIKDATEKNQIMTLVEDLEMRAKILRPLEAEKRQLWRLFVDFAKPYPHVFQQQTPQ
ncbi:hypothetical protein PG993_011953 [Apiospora rasikravindrae]|uniref:Uncharacterized protein n=1 Tax=Apiospora rasikravindrae TaxID=990691 RepID=A0ABR1S2E9_9PEZI